MTSSKNNPGIIEMASPFEAPQFRGNQAEQLSMYRPHASSLQMPRIA